MKKKIRRLARQVRRTFKPVRLNSGVIRARTVRRGAVRVFACRSNGWRQWWTADSIESHIAMVRYLSMGGTKPEWW